MSDNKAANTAVGGVQYYGGGVGVGAGADAVDNDSLSLVMLILKTRWSHCRMQFQRECSFLLKWLIDNWGFPLKFIISVF